MSDEHYVRLLTFGERVGVPTVILLLTMLGGYQLISPLASAAIGFMTSQVQAMERLAEDVRQTRMVVERHERAFGELTANQQKMLEALGGGRR